MAMAQLLSPAPVFPTEIISSAAEWAAIPVPNTSPAKKRDIETGKDYFGARYYSSDLGRFLSPDWTANAIGVPYASLGDPQTLNLYAYVENGPLNRADADGHADQRPGINATNLTCLSPSCLQGLTSSLSPDAILQGNAGLNAAIYEAGLPGKRR
jgi:RHS repeat-associated protein